MVAFFNVDQRPKRIALLGDSINSQNTGNLSGFLNFYSRGPIYWAMVFLGWPWEIEPSDNFAVGGTTSLAVLESQIPLLRAASLSTPYERVFINTGTNDTNSGRPVATIKENYLAIAQAVRDLGAIPVFLSIRPRGTDGAMTNAKKQNDQLNEWLHVNARAYGWEFINVNEVHADNSTARGNALPANMYDSGSSNLHPNQRGAMLEGRIIADYYRARGIGPSLVFATSQADVFDRTHNPAGVAFASANPLLQGGTTAPTGMTTSGGTWSKASRTLSNGQTRSDPTVADLSLSAATTHYLYDDWTKTGAWAATDLQPGDVLEGRALVALTDSVNINRIELTLVENDGNASLSATSGAGETDGLLNVSGTQLLYLRTPRLTVRPYFGSGNVSIFQRLNVITGAGSAGSFGVRAFEARKVA